MSGKPTLIRRVGLPAGPLLAVLFFLLLPTVYVDSAGELRDFGFPGRVTAALAAWMAIWWLTETVHITVTALLPIVVLPLLGARPSSDVTAPYAHPLVFLFMGGFIIALAMERWGLHRRIALRVLSLVGTRPRNMVGGFMLVTAFLSMWVSNTATTLMMLPIALSVIDLVSGSRSAATTPLENGRSGVGDNFAVCLLLGIAYGASIGGIGTIIGTPPNVFLVSYVEEHLGTEISFASWLLIGLPLVFVFVPVTWALLCWVIVPIRTDRIDGGDALIRDALRELGPTKRGEWITLVVFLLTAAAWIFRHWLNQVPFLAGLTDPGIAMLAALILFVTPVDIRKREFTMDWETAARLPWGTLLLFGGGLSLAGAIRDNGVGEFLGSRATGLQGMPELALVLVVVAGVIFLTELTSNLATTATLVPLLAEIAPEVGVEPLVLIVPATVAASCAFMMPVATPPNAVVFGSGKITVAQMVKAGFWLNLVGIVLVTLLTRLIRVIQ